MDGNGLAETRAIEAIRIHAPARLHLGLIDMNGSLGRRFGSIGLAIDAPAVDVEVRRAASMTASGPEADRALRYARNCAEMFGFGGDYAIVVNEVMPAHAGFGSGTQIALALAEALSRLSGKAIDLRKVGSRLERGARSGIGVASFLDGGFVVDGGRGPKGEVPPVIARHPFPEDWRLLLIIDPNMEGVHGPEEAEAFRRLPQMPDAETAHLCRLVMMQLLPGLVEADISSVGAALTEIQARLGDHFAPAQGGRRFASARVSDCLAEAFSSGAAGVGQSSWGPTGFALVGSEAEAEALRERLVRNCHSAEGLRFITARGRNRGATVIVNP
ncbi:beta-ribofuranosylaminobenzene 5'-phosphate synthase family protein [Oryzibacter oryziterrae]|uniref:beta-ribofuranosylaminobenzene 5'-phosphate synthase family protein n=1 Tax=Oryzibacter oryziterrae TaxID=2766474 RepID=UPI001F2FEDD4|nr:beta-ribofuranosylaminobenzene 5'-phosphate synthase family protein [Oryzibacter oryziterrae]